jgi:hypothetical protein
MIVTEHPSPGLEHLLVKIPRGHEVALILQHGSEVIERSQCAGVILTEHSAGGGQDPFVELSRCLKLSLVLKHGGQVVHRSERVRVISPKGLGPRRNNLLIYEGCLSEEPAELLILACCRWITRPFGSPAQTIAQARYDGVALRTTARRNRHGAAQDVDRLIEVSALTGAFRSAKQSSS